jgi:site-specific DNA recombinase
MGIPCRPSGKYTDEYTWLGTTVSKMLSRPEYLGHTVNFKTYHKSFKNKKTYKRDPSEWLIFKNTHEAIIDQETFRHCAAHPQRQASN